MLVLIVLIILVLLCTVAVTIVASLPKSTVGPSPTPGPTTPGFTSQEAVTARQYLTEVYPSCNWSSFSDQDVANFVYSLTFYYQVGSGLVKTNLFSIAALATQLQGVYSSFSDCGPNNWGGIPANYPALLSYCGNSPRSSVWVQQLETAEFGLLPPVGTFQYLTAEIGLYDKIVFRNAYDPANFTTSVLPCPASSIGATTLTGGPVVGFTGGYESGGALEVVHFSSTSKYSPDVFWYGVAGSGNFLKLGVTLQARNKVDACLKLIPLAVQNGFRGFYSSPGPYSNSWSHQTQTPYTVMQSNPEIFLLEILESMGKYSNTLEATQDLADETFQFNLSIPNQAILNFVNEVGLLNNTVSACGGQTPCNNSIAAVSKPSSYTQTLIADAGYPNVKPLLVWFFTKQGVELPQNYWFQTILTTWTDSQKQCLTQFFQNVSNCQYDDWQMQYVFNRIANSDLFDYLARSLVVQDSDSSPAFTYDTTGALTAWSGMTLDTIQLSQQPSGNAGWDYEVQDFRFVQKNATDPTTGLPTPDAILQWNDFTERYLVTGSPFKTDTIQTCQLEFQQDLTFLVSKCQS